MKMRFLMAVVILGMLAAVVSGCASEPTASAQGNFRLLVSDQPNAISDFEHLNVTISRIGVQMVGDNSTWIEFSPNIATIDLTTLQGDNAEEIWDGNLTPGQYNKVFIYVSSVEGILAPSAGNGTANVKLPSGKLQISTPFTVSGNGTTSLVFDVTVIKAGNSGKYILKPQIADSGANQSFTEVTPTQEQEQQREQALNKLHLSLQGPSEQGAAAVLTVRSQGQPVAGASVTVNSQAVGTTGADGKINITIPNVSEVKIVATLGQKSGELDLEFD